MQNVGRFAIHFVVYGGVIKSYERKFIKFTTILRVHEDIEFNLYIKCYLAIYYANYYGSNTTMRFAT